MISEEQFAVRVAALELQGFSAPQAARLAGQLGDCIETAEDGRWIIRDRDTGEELARVAPLAEAGPGLDETCRATVGDTEAALRSYAQAFPGATLDWLHPSLVGTAQLLELIQEHIAKGVPVTVAAVEARFGPFAWEW